MFTQNYFVVDADDQERVFASFDLARDAIACLEKVFGEGYAIKCANDDAKMILETVPKKKYLTT